MHKSLLTLALVVVAGGLVNTYIIRRYWPVTKAAA
jgi:hypothetical protein